MYLEQVMRVTTQPESSRSPENGSQSPAKSGSRELDRLAPFSSNKRSHWKLQRLKSAENVPS